MGTGPHCQSVAKVLKIYVKSTLKSAILEWIEAQSRFRKGQIPGNRETESRGCRPMAGIAGLPERSPAFLCESATDLSE